MLVTPAFTVLLFDLMKISIIIPVKPGGEVRAVAALRRLVPSPLEYEVIVAEGRRPSCQRNRAAAEAAGEILYFLDDDSCVAPDALVRLSSHMQDSAVAAVGGPSVTPGDDNPLQRAIAWVLASAFGGGAIRNRYRRHGQVRCTDDRELILCNLAFRKDVFLAAGGLDERLYPNEENELIDRLLAGGHRLLHDPDMFVTRSQRPNLRAFIRQMTTYGRGRAEQTMLSRSIDGKALVPALFVWYLLLMPFAFVWWYLLPAALYAAIIVASMLAACRRESFALVWRIPIVYLLMHVCYGTGFMAGFFAPRYRHGGTAAGDVRLVRLKKMDGDW
jgi:cellulose synthase/poly-beta-1,6-N-acetylglucosamine synthase-like glycosyltransferase